MNTPTPTDPLDLSSPESTAHVDRMLDEAVAESFPASDPVALSQPHDRIEAPSSAMSSSSTASLWNWRAMLPYVVMGAAVLALLLPRHRE